MAKLNKIIIPVFILLAVFVGAKTLYSGTSQKPVDIEAKDYPEVVKAMPIESNIISPDGKHELVVKEKKDGVNTLWTATVDKELVFNESLTDTISLSVPFNTFSPDNKYIFLKESSNDLDYYVVLSSDGKQNMEVTKYFYAKYTNYKITDVTGWAAPTLLVVNTDKVSGGVGPSFWFDVSSKSFIQLSTRFN